MTHLYLGLLLFSFTITGVLVVPFINLLYRLRFQRQNQKTLDFQNRPTPIFDQFHHQKAGTPVGGGLLIILVVCLLYLLLFPILNYLHLFEAPNFPIRAELNLLFFTFISFGLLGLYDDIYKFFGFSQTGFFGLRLRHKLTLQTILAVTISLLLYFQLHIDFLYIPLLGPILLGPFIIPISTLFIVLFANFFNITDGLDGLSSGLLTIALFAFWILAGNSLDSPISVFLGLWIGSLIAFLYFNIYPARIWLGDVGSMSFGATFAVVGLILGKIFVLLVIGGVFVVEVASSLFQLTAKKYWGKKIMAVAPLHLWLQYKGWPEPKVVMRAWLIGIMLSALGLWMALITHQ